MHTHRFSVLSVLMALSIFFSFYLRSFHSDKSTSVFPTQKQSFPNFSRAIQLPKKTSGNFSYTIETGRDPLQNSVQAFFEMPDTVCLNSPINIINKSTNATTYRWDFCTANVDQSPTGVQLGNPGNSLGIPVFSDYAYDNGNYYAFVVNNTPGGLIRLNFGNSLLNTPIVTNLGNFGGSIPNSAQGLQVLKFDGRWYAFVLGGDPLIGIASRIVKLDFGNALTNTPSSTNWGNVGNMNYPVDLFIFQEMNNWYGLTVNYRDNTITQFDFGADFSSTPSGKNLGNKGNLNLPSGICPINDNGNWRVFVSNYGNNTLSRIDFGSSLLSNPVGQNLGNVGNKLNAPRDLFIFKYCEKEVGFLVNGGTGDLVRLDFPSLSTIPLANSLGIIGGTSNPHSISKIFRDGADLYAFLPNASTNTLSRIKFTGCTNANISSSVNENPPPILYSKAGTYNIILTVDEGLPTQSSFCKKVVVLEPANLQLTRDYTVCGGYDSIPLLVSNTFTVQWTPSVGLSNASIANPKAAPQQSVTYLLDVVDKNKCTVQDSVKITVNPSISVTIRGDTAICSGQSVSLSQVSPSGLSYQWSPAIALNNATLPVPIATPLTNTLYSVVASSPYGCLARDTIAIIVHPAIQFSLSATSAEICKGDSVSLTASGADLYYWLPSTVSGNSVKWFKPDSTILISAKLYRADCNYADTLSKNIVVYKRPLANIFLQDTLLCEGQSVLLNSVTESDINYQWSPVLGLNNANIPNPTVTPIVSNKYYLKAFSVPYCYTTDSVMISVKAPPDFTLSPLTDTICIGTSILLKTSGSEKSKWLNKQFAQSVTAYTLLVKPDSTQVYPIQLFDSTCNLMDTLYSTIVVSPKPVIELTKSNDFYCNVDTVFLRASGGAYYEWQPANKVSNPGISNPYIAQNYGKQIFEVTVYSSRGCSSSKSILVNDFTYPARQFLVPNAFTPNNDGLNDCFGVIKWGGAVRNFRMNIYNRGGQMIFSSNEVSNCWDGKANGIPQPSGTYIYLIEASTDCESINRNGSFVLIR